MHAAQDSRPLLRVGDHGLFDWRADLLERELLHAQVLVLELEVALVPYIRVIRVIRVILTRFANLRICKFANLRLGEG